MMGIPRPGNVRSLLCEGTDLDGYVQFSSQTEREAFQNVSCSLSQQQLINTQQVLLQNMDIRKVLSGVSLFPANLYRTNISPNLSNKLCLASFGYLEILTDNNDRLVLCTDLM
ncbi:hypothetical protein XENOCAPTIV_024207 [Xenoophorus captivus]|uniref:Uncharacterized protein n=1 Tax=Xenoophorus captivus TaxID=1517983 RepID=A0ABV0RDB8_9TELE